jgi:uncharacterized membrane protein YgaE (UPF0421/DUF939 family)
MDVATLDLLTKLKLNKPILNSLVLLLHMYMKEDISLFFLPAGKRLIDQE